MNEELIDELYTLAGDLDEDARTLREEYEEIARRRKLIILQLNELGESCACLADILGLSPGRVSQICIQAREIMQQREAENASGRGTEEDAARRGTHHSR